jgi:hypothetical protein
LALLSSFSSVEYGESLPANTEPPEMNCSRPAPDPTGSYEIVTPELASWNLAIQASWAACCADDPAPAISPDRLLPLLLLLPPLSSSSPPQAAAPRASAPHVASARSFLMRSSP